jgi:hypothetical protein
MIEKQETAAFRSEGKKSRSFTVAKVGHWIPWLPALLAHLLPRAAGGGRRSALFLSCSCRLTGCLAIVAKGDYCTGKGKGHVKA